MNGYVSEPERLHVAANKLDEGADRLSSANTGFAESDAAARRHDEYNTQAKIEVKPPTTPGGPPEVTVTYQTQVRDRYNWDNGKSTEVPGLGVVTDADMQRLHRTGLAQEFDMGGTGRMRTRSL